MASALALQEQDTQTAPARNPSPMDLLQMAVSQKSDIDTVERLARLATDFMERQARTEFFVSLHEAQAEMKRIGVDALNPQTRSKYATYSKLDGAIRPIYTKHGFSVSFNTAAAPKDDSIMVRAYVTHRGGFMLEYEVPMPADGKGAKGGDVMTKTHATGSAISYGQRYLLKMIFNVAVGETDDDGNGAEGKHMDSSHADEFLSSIGSASSVDELQKVYLEAIGKAKAVGDSAAERAFSQAKNARYRQLVPKAGA